MTLSRSKAAPQSTLLFGPLAQKGISLHRYCYKSSTLSTVSDSFQNGSLLLLLNLSGHGEFCCHSTKKASSAYHISILPQKVMVQIKQNELLSLERRANEEHRFFILEITRDWFSRLLKEYPHPLKTELASFPYHLTRKTEPLLLPFCSNLRSLSEEFLLVSNQNARPTLWIYAKILELLAHTLLKPSEHFCCHRKDYVALQRISTAKKILTHDLLQPPSLTECAKAAGCSSAYLSRIFSQYTGMTMSRYLRNVRLNRAAQLLQAGSHNVTEAAMAVGYSSLSHFSKAFSEVFHTLPCSFGSSSQIRSFTLPTSLQKFPKRRGLFNPQKKTASHKQEYSKRNHN